MKIAFIGGGAIAKAIGSLVKTAGHDVVLGVRAPSKKTDEAGLKYGTIEESITDADVVLIAVPYYVIDDVLPQFADALAGKLVVDATNPVATDWTPILTGEEFSGAEHIAEILSKSRVVKAFNTIFADILQQDRLDRSGRKITLFVAGDDAAAKQTVMKLGSEIGLEPLNAGPLKSARYLEAMAHLNIELAVGQGGGTNAAFIYDQAA